MKKKFVLMVSFLCVMIAAKVAWARPTPSQRTCRIAGGQPWVIWFTRDSADDLELCRFGDAAIGSFAFFSQTVLKESTEAVNAYFQSQSCEQRHGQIRQGRDSDDFAFTVCVFSDGSAIETQTLSLGPDAAANRQLTEQLHTTLE